MCNIKTDESLDVAATFDKNEAELESWKAIILVAATFDKNEAELESWKAINFGSCHIC